MSFLLNSVNRMGMFHISGWNVVVVTTYFPLFIHECIYLSSFFFNAMLITSQWTYFTVILHCHGDDSVYSKTLWHCYCSTCASRNHKIRHYVFVMKLFLLWNWVFIYMKLVLCHWKYIKGRNTSWYCKVISCVTYSQLLYRSAKGSSEWVLYGKSLKYSEWVCVIECQWLVSEEIFCTALYLFYRLCWHCTFNSCCEFLLYNWFHCNCGHIFYCTWQLFVFLTLPYLTLPYLTLCCIILCYMTLRCTALLYDFVLFYFLLLCIKLSHNLFEITIVLFSP